MGPSALTGVCLCGIGRGFSASPVWRAIPRRSGGGRSTAHPGLLPGMAGLQRAADVFAVDRLPADVPRTSSRWADRTLARRARSLLLHRLAACHVLAVVD